MSGVHNALAEKDQANYEILSSWQGCWRKTFGQGSFLESINDTPKTARLTHNVNPDGADDGTNNP